MPPIVRAAERGFFGFCSVTTSTSVVLKNSISAVSLSKIDLTDCSLLTQTQTVSALSVVRV